MSKLKTEIRKFVPKSLKYNMYYYFGKNHSSQFNVNTSKVFIMLAGDYGNLGDIAITEAQKQFIQKNLEGYEIIPVYLNNTLKMIKTIKNIIKPNDIITIIGGGNMGDLYEGYENLRRNLIKSFPNNRIISFPQTIDFSTSESGKKSFQKTLNSYNSHTDLHIFARESISFEIMKKSFSNNIVNLVPDIVLSLKMEKERKEKRDGIVLCLRNDSEVKLDESTRNDMIKLINNKFTNVSFHDTHLGSDGEGKHKSFKDLQSAFYNLLDRFSNSKLVITDRLHGMIFCAITGTPCIVLPNSNHKIKGTYKDWLKDVEYISLIEEINSLDSFLNTVDSLLNINSDSLNIIDLNKHYQSLRDSLNI